MRNLTSWDHALLAFSLLAGGGVLSRAPSILQFTDFPKEVDEKGHPTVDAIESEGECSRKRFAVSSDLVRPLFDVNVNDLTIRWATPTEAVPGILVIGGQIGLAEANRADLDWYQGVSLYIAPYKGQAVAGNDGKPKMSCIWIRGYMYPGGHFEFTIPAHLLHRQIGDAHTYNVALGLAKHTSSVQTDKPFWEIEWCREAGIIPSSLADLVVPGATALNGHQSLINAIEERSSSLHDPLATIKCVNHFIALGKRRALTELRDYVMHSQDVMEGHGDIRNLDCSCARRALVLAAFLFEGSSTEDRESPLDNWLASGDSSELWRNLMPLYPFALVEGLPVVVNPRDDYLERWNKEQVIGYLDWCDAKGVIRAYPLAPSPAPINGIRGWLGSPVMLDVAKTRGGMAIVGNAEPELTPWVLQFFRVFRSVCPGGIGESADAVLMGQIVHGSEVAAVWNIVANYIMAVNMNWDDRSNAYRITK